MKKGRLLLIDLDGTTIPNDPKGIPSEKVIRAIKKAYEKMHISAATGRPFSFNLRTIFDALELKDPCIISGGTQIIDPTTEKVLWEKTLSSDQIKSIEKICKKYPYEFLLDGEKPNKENSKSANIAFFMYVNKTDTRKMVKALEATTNIAIHTVPSWKKDHKDIHITHFEATKEHALAELLKILNVKKENAIAVGDGGNDLPLFRGVGYKIAMGNADERLKKEADFITGSVEEDGLATAIEKLL